MPLLDAETGDYLSQVYGGAAAFLFGRRTYEIFAASWGSIAEMRTSPIGAALNSRPKYVVSTSLSDPRWAGTTVLTGDIAAAVRDLKSQQEGELPVFSMEVETLNALLFQRVLPARAIADGRVRVKGDARALERFVTIFGLSGHAEPTRAAVGLQKKTRNR